MLNRQLRYPRAVFQLILILGLLWPAGSSPGQSPVMASGGATSVQRSASLRQVSAGARMAYHAQTGRLRFIGADPARPLALPAVTPAGLRTRVQAARAHLATYAAQFGLQDVRGDLRVMREKALDGGRGWVRFQQTHQGIPVFGGELIVMMDSDDRLIAAMGETSPELDLAVVPAVDAQAAEGLAVEAAARQHKVHAGELMPSTPELWIFDPRLVRPGGGPPRLVWRIEVKPVDPIALERPIRELVLIDALRGGVALQLGQVNTALNRETYRYETQVGTLPGTFVCGEADPECTAGDAHAQGAHSYARDAYNFYLTYHGRDSIDNAGMTIISTVHYATGQPAAENSYWFDNQLIYGDAFGFPLADDVVAHEYTHGVTERESGLFHYYQSGSIEESFSDLWGEFVDLTNGAGNDDPGVRWQIGEDVTGLGAFRDLADPESMGFPERMTSPNYYTGELDNGGVFTNSLVSSRAATLMVDGGTVNTVTVAAMGITKTAAIYYEAQTNLLTSGADYADLHEALYQACLNQIGTAGITSADCQEVREATLVVEMDQQPVTGYNSEASLCLVGLAPLYWFYDDLENGAGNWTFGVITGTVTSRWGYDSPYGVYAHSGQHFLYAPDEPNASDTYASVAAGVSLPSSPGAYLRFSHAYGFEGPNFDGGIVEYSTDGGAIWFDALILFDANGYDGQILSTGNPLHPRQAFVNDSHGYISSRLNLSTLAGQSVRFRWRMGLDTGGLDQGWWLDDVGVYTCEEPGVFLPIIRTDDG